MQTVYSSFKQADTKMIFHLGPNFHTGWIFVPSGREESARTDTASAERISYLAPTWASIPSKPAVYRTNEVQEHQHAVIAVQLREQQS